ncbi:hypothetical protein EJ08DRAFT_648486 [Tothia fuscella]|uniref:Ubiquitin-like domain-containing protein n=1 Tax=Tothia fuscella TaxID=1048955 RepID=A0A9P4NVM0_9PEZI|nr:hypothetical protein EJ08DRAFT_648486 [Tothia fuscella]
MSSSLPDEVIDIIIRFTASLPDLHINISSPRTTPFVALKIRIRDHLPSELSSNRIRLIHAGKVLDDILTLSTFLNRRAKSPPVIPPPPKSSKGKGKEPVQNDGSGTTPPLSKDGIYINCSIGDALTPEEIENEAILATCTHQNLLQNAYSSVSSTHPSIPTSKPLPSQPLGFDRLLSTGFTPTDIATLRSTFLTHLSHTHTPSTLPHGDSLRLLEERWLDNTTLPGEAGSGGGISVFDAEDEGSALDDMFWGNIIGFFWPLGAVVWGLRAGTGGVRGRDGRGGGGSGGEMVNEGDAVVRGGSGDGGVMAGGEVWSTRRKIAVATGVAINLVFGFAKISSR